MGMNPDIAAVLAGERRWTVITADCLDVLPTLPDGCVPMIWTDPPYGHGNQQEDLQAARVRDGVRGARKAACEPIANDTMGEFRDVLAAFVTQAVRVLDRDCCCCCCCCCGGGPEPTFAFVADLLDRDMAFFHAVVWDKSGRGNGMGWRYRRNYEFVMVAHKTGGKLAWNEAEPAMPNVLRDCPPMDRYHPNEKPVELVRRFIRAHVPRGSVVLDPFTGSGTTGVAAMLEGCRFIGIEMDKRHAETARMRIAAEEAQRPLFEAAKAPVSEQLGLM